MFPGSSLPVHEVGCVDTLGVAVLTYPDADRVERVKCLGCGMVFMADPDELDCGFCGGDLEWADDAGPDRRPDAAAAGGQGSGAKDTAGGPLLTIKAVGDAMAPTIRDGDLLFVDASQRRVRWEGVYVVAAAGVLIARRFAFNPLGGVEVYCDNPSFGERERLSRAELDRLDIVGRVVGRAGRI